MVDAPVFLDIKVQTVIKVSRSVDGFTLIIMESLFYHVVARMSPVTCVVFQSYLSVPPSAVSRTLAVWKKL